MYWEIQLMLVVVLGTIFTKLHDLSNNLSIEISITNSEVVSLTSRLSTEESTRLVKDTSFTTRLSR